MSPKTIARRLRRTRKRLARLQAADRLQCQVLEQIAEIQTLLAELLEVIRPEQQT